MKKTGLIIFGINMKTLKYIIPVCCVALASCSEANPDKAESEITSDGGTVLTAVIGTDTRTILGDKVGQEYPILWTAGDKINVNGESSSEAAVKEGSKQASFTFGKEMTAPYSAVYPASAYKAEGVITIPSMQSYVAGSFDPASSVMCSYSGGEATLHFHHLMAYLKLSFNTESDKDNIKSISVKSAGNEAMSGDFNVDFENSILTPVAEKAVAVVMDCGREGVAPGTPVIVAIPARNYASGLQITTVDVNGDKTVHKLKSALNAVAGTVYNMSITFELYPGSRLKPIKVGNLLWAPVYCGYSAAHPNGLLYQYGRAKGQPYYPAGKASAVCVAGPTSDPADDKFYKDSKDWYSGTALASWPMSKDDAGYVEGKIGNPCPDGWRLPTVAEFEGLMKIGFTQSTSWTFSANGTDAQNEAKRVETGFTIKGNSGLFFAAVGGRTSEGQSYYRGSGSDAYARIWANDIKSGTETGKASCLSLRRIKTSNDANGFTMEINSQEKAVGMSVRCVKSAN